MGIADLLAADPYSLPLDSFVHFTRRLYEANSLDGGEAVDILDLVRIQGPGFYRCLGGLEVTRMQ